MSPEIRIALDRAVIETVGALAFMDASPADLCEGATESLLVTIALLGPTEGTLRLHIPEADADILTRAAWGALEGDLTQQRTDFLSELANVVAGSFLAHHHPGKAVQIGFPDVRRSTQREPEAEACYDVEGCRLCLDLISRHPSD